jgi:hypothetical protein
MPESPPALAPAAAYEGQATEVKPPANDALMVAFAGRTPHMSTIIEPGVFM